mmetsp:Transcript_66057/g.182910  ORF Transcript_66057/g.182910 Transcript_66057/m.182910 type:complete len:433 (-) Transcript_66057:745-2043(-)
MCQGVPRLDPGLDLGGGGALRRAPRGTGARPRYGLAGGPLLAAQHGQEPAVEGLLRRLVLGHAALQLALLAAVRERLVGADPDVDAVHRGEHDAAGDRRSGNEQQDNTRDVPHHGEELGSADGEARGIAALQEAVYPVDELLPLGDEGCQRLYEARCLANFVLLLAQNERPFLNETLQESHHVSLLITKLRAWLQTPSFPCRQLAFHSSCRGGIRHRILRWSASSLPCISTRHVHHVRLHQAALQGQQSLLGLLDVLVDLLHGLRGVRGGDPAVSTVQGRPDHAQAPHRLAPNAGPRAPRGARAPDPGAEERGHARRGGPGAGAVERRAQASVENRLRRPVLVGTLLQCAHSRTVRRGLAAGRHGAHAAGRDDGDESGQGGRRDEEEHCTGDCSHSSNSLRGVGYAPFQLADLDEVFQLRQQLLSLLDQVLQ